MAPDAHHPCRDLILVTHNRGDFLKLYAAQAIHNGLIVIVPSVPRDTQMALLEAALAVVEQTSDLVKSLVEVFEDGRVQVRDWQTVIAVWRVIQSKAATDRGPAYGPAGNS